MADIFSITARLVIPGANARDHLGGYDPYSSSKAAAEIAVASWRRSFFQDHPVRIATARAGNVIGGGDWATDRILPDCIRALQRGEAIRVRNSGATRPWQHVLEPLSGYLWLAAVLSQPLLWNCGPKAIPSAFNFGPGAESNRSVAELVTEVLKHWPGSWEDISNPNAVHEAKLLNLATDRAFHMLGWKSVWSFEKAVNSTIAWYRKAEELAASPLCSAAAQLAELTSEQIRAYEEDANSSGLPWAACWSNL
jgi:CDP-glucose 4,6-dehydratase